MVPSHLNREASIRASPARFISAAAIADGSIADADTSFRDTLAEQSSGPAGEAEDE